MLKLCAALAPTIALVLDTAVLVQAVLSSGGPARDALRLILRKQHTLILSNEMLHELGRVLRYPRLMARHRLTEGQIYRFLGSLRDPLLRAPIRDVNDIIVMQTAILGEAGLLCTPDRDFYEPPAAEFLAKLGIAVLDDVALLRRLRT